MAHTLHEPIQALEVLLGPGALSQDVVEHLAGGAGVAQLAVVERLEDVSGFLFVLDQTGHLTEELAQLGEEPLGRTDGQLQLASRTELECVGETLLTVDELLLRRRVLGQQGLQALEDHTVVSDRAHHPQGFGVLGQPSEEGVQTLVVRGLHHPGRSRGTDLDEVLSFDELTRVAGDLLELDAHLGQDFVHPGLGLGDLLGGGRRVTRGAGVLLVEVDVVRRDLAVVVDHEVGVGVVLATAGSELVTQDAQGLQVIGGCGLGAELPDKKVVYIPTCPEVLVGAEPATGDVCLCSFLGLLQSKVPPDKIRSVQGHVPLAVWPDGGA